MAKRGLGKGLGAFFGEEDANTKETSGEKVSRSERKEQLMGKTAEKKPENTAKNTEKRGIAENGDAGKSSVVKNQERIKMVFPEMRRPQTDRRQMNQSSSKRS